MKKLCLVVDDIHTSVFPDLENIGIEVDYRPYIRREKILQIIPNYQGIVIRSKTQIDKEFLDAASSLEFIARAGAGLDQIDVEETKIRNIKIVNAPEGNRDAVAEHTMGLLLGLLNNIYQSHNQIKSGIWDREGNRGTELNTKTIGLIGYGNMGEAFARRAVGFGCNVIAYDKYKSGYASDFVREVTLEQLKQESDILSLHIPLTDETDRMINTEFIESFSKNIYILNTSRGEIVSLKDLKVQIQKGKILGAGLDVHEYEKVTDLSEEQQNVFDFFKTADNVLLTPHVAGWSFQSYEKISKVLLEKIKNIYL